MAFLIDQLISNPVARPDKELPIPDRMMAPERPRDLYGVLANLGPYTSQATLTKNVDYAHSSVHSLTYAALARMPTLAEIDAHAGAAADAQLLISLLISEEFRRHAAQRVMETFPDRKRMFWLELPGHGHAPLLAAVATRAPLMPVLPDAPTLPRERGIEALQRLSVFLRDLRGTREMLVVAQRQFGLLHTTEAPPPALPDPALSWQMRAAPVRDGDTITTVLDEPERAALRLLAEKIALLAENGEGKETRRLRQQMQLPEGGGQDAILERAEALVKAVLPRNPLCSALGDGTLEVAIALCAEGQTELTDLGGIARWFPSRWDIDHPETPPAAPLDAALLPAPARELLRQRISLDLRFYEQFKTRLDRSGWVALSGLAMR